MQPRRVQHGGMPWSSAHVSRPAVEDPNGVAACAGSRLRAALACIGAAAVVGAVAAWAAPASAQTGPTIGAADLVAALASGQPIDATNLRIVGLLDLTTLPNRQVTQALRCDACVITGGVRATDVVFARSVDLDGVQVLGPTDLRGAEFRGPVLVRGDTPESGFAEPVDASFAKFDDAVGFDGLRFGSDVTFAGARFARDVSFAGSAFDGDANFDQVTFGGIASFRGLRSLASDSDLAAFAGAVTFRNSVFQSAADLALRRYRRGLELSGAVFVDLLTVANAEVTGEISGRGSAVATLDARSLIAHGDVDLTELRGGSVNLDRSIIEGTLLLGKMTVVGTTSLRGLTLGRDLLAADLVSGQLDMDLDLVQRAGSTSTQEQLLTRIEATERTRGNSAAANDAEYRLLRMQGDRQRGLAGLVDRVLYQWIAGYLVRPSHPLVSLALLALLGTVARALYDRLRSQSAMPELDSELNRAGRLTVRVGAPVASWLNCLSRALAADLRPKPNIALRDEDRSRPYAYLIAGMKLFEYVASKLLILVFLLSLANYNQTLRQLIEGVKP